MDKRTKKRLQKAFVAVVTGLALMASMAAWNGNMTSVAIIAIALAIFFALIWGVITVVF